VKKMKLMKLLFEVVENYSCALKVDLMSLC